MASVLKFLDWKQWFSLTLCVYAVAHPIFVYFFFAKGVGYEK